MEVELNDLIARHGSGISDGKRDSTTAAHVNALWHTQIRILERRIAETVTKVEKWFIGIRPLCKPRCVRHVVRVTGTVRQHHGTFLYFRCRVNMPAAPELPQIAGILLGACKASQRKLTAGRNFTKENFCNCP